MAPKNRMTARKRMFGDLEDEETSRDLQGFHSEDTNFQTTANLQNLQHECADGSQQFGRQMKNDKTSAKKKLLRRTIFFEDSEDEGTSIGLQSFHDKDINVETTMDPCSFQDKYAARSDQSVNDDDNIIGICRLLLDILLFDYCYKNLD